MLRFPQKFIYFPNDVIVILATVTSDAQQKSVYQANLLCFEWTVLKVPANFSPLLDLILVYKVNTNSLGGAK